MSRISSSLEKLNLSKVVFVNVKSEMEFLSRQIEELERKARTIADDNGNLMLKFGRLLEIKSVSEKATSAVLADISDFPNFEKLGRFSAFSGVTPLHLELKTPINGK